jgi:aminoglycoside 6'-N-acetyltransferase I
VERLRRAESADDAGWLERRRSLWADVPDTAHRTEMAAIVAQPERYAAFLIDVDDRTVAFAEASVRHEYVNGTSSSPVAFLEGLSVAPDAWRRGHARRLVEAVAAWGRALGCRELASDAHADNTAGILAHKAVGFEETERVVYFRKEL